ncbi:MAG TPA: site-specific tyrosine recombinase XerD [Planctomycetaceae bacterium]|jgi:integrase/recombinase XerD|nr:site-specific tyrosine recombinase XerD [Planctomycetaceae bacterium]
MPPRKRPVAGSGFTAIRLDRPASHLEQFLKYLQAEAGMSGNTLTAYSSDLQQFFGWLDSRGIQGLGQVELSVLVDWLGSLHERELSAATVSRHLVSVKMFFRYLVLEAVIPESVADLLNSPKLWQHLPHVMSPDMVDRLLAAPQAADRYMLRDRALLTVLYATGCRASEVSGLTLRSLNLAEGYCRCLGKGNKERIVRLNPVARLALENYLQHERPLLVGLRQPEAVFVSRTGAPLGRIEIWRLVKKYARRCGASGDVSPHTLRHSFATHLLAGGAELRALQELLGHASIATTQIYTHVEHSRLKAVHSECHPRG